MNGRVVDIAVNGHSLVITYTYAGGTVAKLYRRGKLPPLFKLSDRASKTKVVCLGKYICFANPGSTELFLYKKNDMYMYAARPHKINVKHKILDLAVDGDRIYFITHSDSKPVYYVVIREDLYNVLIQDNIKSTRSSVHCLDNAEPLQKPEYIAVNQGIVAVTCADPVHHLRGCVTLLDTTGKKIAVLWEVKGMENFIPRCIAIDDKKHIYVADYESKVLVVFSSDGEVLSRLETEHKQPISMVLTKKGAIYLTYGDSEVHLYTYKTEE